MALECDVGWNCNAFRSMVAPSSDWFPYHLVGQPLPSSVCMKTHSRQELHACWLQVYRSDSDIESKIQDDLDLWTENTLLSDKRMKLEHDIDRMKAEVVWLNKHQSLQTEANTLSDEIRRIQIKLEYMLRELESCKLTLSSHRESLDKISTNMSTHEKSRPSSMCDQNVDQDTELLHDTRAHEMRQAAVERDKIAQTVVQTSMSAAPQLSRLAVKAKSAVSRLAFGGDVDQDPAGGIARSCDV